jgi:hypothetical protein
MSLLPARVNHTIYRGADFIKVVTLLTGGLGSSAQNLTGWTGVLRILDRQTSATLLTLTTGAGLTLGGINGTVKIEIPAATTAILNWKIANYELLLTNTDDVTNPYMQGQFNVTGL